MITRLLACMFIFLLVTVASIGLSIYATKDFDSKDATKNLFMAEAIKALLFTVLLCNLLIEKGIL